MASNHRAFYRVFVASPGDVKAERDAVASAVEELNEYHGPAQGYQLELVRWETHATPGAGRPQQVILDQVGRYDIFVGIMWRRCGTPTGVADSGTVEEYQHAYSAWQKDNSRPVMVYFCQEPFMPKTLEELDQMRRVLSFRQEIKGQGLDWEYGGENKEPFEGIIRKHLAERLNELVPERQQKARAHAQPDEETIRELTDLWRRMDPELRRAFSIAYNEKRMAGDAGVQTRDLFAALLRVGSPELQRIVEEIPPNALPEATSGVVVEEPYIVQEHPWLSGCVASSVRRLNKRLPPDRELKPEDIFADIAKNGSGTSVQLLREHDIGPAEVDRILREKDVQVVGT